jgi:hypothetical protein
VSEPEYHEVQLSGSVKSIVGYNLTTNPAGARDSPAVFFFATSLMNLRIDDQVG